MDNSLGKAAVPQCGIELRVDNRLGGDCSSRWVRTKGGRQSGVVAVPQGGL